jgi:hypothetical protein
MKYLQRPGPSIERSPALVAFAAAACAQPPPADLQRHRSRAAEVHQSPMEYLGLTTKNTNYSITCLRVITKKQKITMV